MIFSVMLEFGSVSVRFRNQTKTEFRVVSKFFGSVRF